MSRIDEIKEEIAKLEKEMRSIQNECSHPKTCRKKLSSYEDCSMNYDLQEMELRGHHHHQYICTLCEKEWSEYIRK